PACTNPSPQVASLHAVVHVSVSSSSPSSHSSGAIATPSPHTGSGAHASAQVGGSPPSLVGSLVDSPVDPLVGPPAVSPAPPSLKQPPTPASAGTSSRQREAPRIANEYRPPRDA